MAFWYIGEVFDIWKDLGVYSAVIDWYRDAKALITGIEHAA